MNRFYVGDVVYKGEVHKGEHASILDRELFEAVQARPCGKGDFSDVYWNKLWKWYEAEGYRHVTAYLDTLDLSTFDPKAPPPKTQAFWDIVDSNRALEDAEMADVIDALGNPEAVTLVQIRAKAKGEFFEWLCERKNRRVVPHRLEACGYAPVRNPDAKDGAWKIQGERQTVYAKSTLALRDQIAAARRLTNDR